MATPPRDITDKFGLDYLVRSSDKGAKKAKAKEAQAKAAASRDSSPPPTDAHDASYRAIAARQLLVWVRGVERESGADTVSLSEVARQHAVDARPLVSLVHMTADAGLLDIVDTTGEGDYLVAATKLSRKLIDNGEDSALIGLFTKTAS